MSAVFSSATTQRIALGFGTSTFQNQPAGTLMAWANPTSANLAIVENYIATWSVNTSPTNSRMTIRINVTAGSYSFQSFSRRLDADGGSTAADSATYLYSSGYHHVALVSDWSGQFMRLYVDGAQVAATFVGGWTGNSSNTTSQQAGMAALGDGSNRYINGEIGDVRAYRRALSADEINNIFESKGSDTVYDYHSRWPMSEGAPGTSIPASPVILDVGPGQLHGTGVNNPDWVASPIHPRARRITS